MLAGDPAILMQELPIKLLLAVAVAVEEVREQAAMAVAEMAAPAPVEPRVALEVQAAWAVQAEPTWAGPAPYFPAAMETVALVVRAALTVAQPEP